MSRFLSDRPCPTHGTPVERYIRDNRCCDCQADAMSRSAEKRLARGGACPRCGSVEKLSNGQCRRCHDNWLKHRMSVPCSICGQVERNSAGQCQACGKKLFGRTVPKHKRSDVIALIQAINLQFGVMLGDTSYGGIRFDMRHYDKIVLFIADK